MSAVWDKLFGGDRLRVLVVPPHPDDECLTGLLPLRLQREAGAEVDVRAATYGSSEARRKERRKELESACGVLDWRVLGKGTTPLTVDELAKMLARGRYGLVVCPHARDGHPRHRATHRLVREAIARSPGPGPLVAETDYWMPMEHPNLAVEGSDLYLEWLKAALRMHKGEVARSDYDKRLWAWWVDNIRRGSESLGGAGAAGLEMSAGEMYRVGRYGGGRWRAAWRGGVGWRSGTLPQKMGGAKGSAREKGRKRQGTTKRRKR